MSPSRTALALVVFACSASCSADGVEEYGYRVVASYPHDPSAFTQGLLVRDGVMYESTGQRGASTLRRVDIETGKVLQRLDLSSRFFGEGIAAWNDTIVMLSWRAGTGFVFDIDDFSERQRFDYPGEGWGLATDGTHLIMSDGTDELRFLDPETFEEQRRIRATLRGEPLARLNELEWIDDEVYANVYMTHRIARIDPESGKVTGMIDLEGLLSAAERLRGNPGVLNGIAWDAESKRLFVTGKNWPKLFEIELVELR